MNMKDKNNSDRKWLKRIWGTLPALFLFSLIILIVILFISVSAKKERLEAEKKAQLSQEDPVINVVTMELVPAPIREKISFPGTTEPWISLRLATEVRGEISQKLVNEGDSVKKGDTLIIVDSRDYVNQYKSAKASYEMARTSLDRFKKLLQKKSTTQARLDDAQAQVENFKSAMDIAQLNVARCTIQSPMDGVANKILIEEGQYVKIGDPVAQLLQIDPLKVKVGIPESDVDAVRKLKRFTVTIDALGGRQFQAEMHYLSKTTDTMARLYDLKMKLENPGGIILPDMFARVEIIKQEIPQAIAVPLYAIVSRLDEQVVYVVNDEKAHLRKIEIGLLEGWKCEVTSGLSAGDEVIVVGQRSVGDGQKVRVMRRIKDLKELAR